MIAGQRASWDPRTPDKKIVDHKIESRPPVARDKRDSILAMDLGSGLIDTEMGSCHFDVDRVLFDGGEPGTWKQCLQLQRDGARAKTQ